MRQKDVDVIADIVARCFKFADEVTKPGIVEVARDLAHDMKYVNASLDVSALQEVGDG